MKSYTVVLDGAESQVGIESRGEHGFTVVIDGASIEIDARSAGQDSLSLLIDNRSIDVTHICAGDRWELLLGGRSHSLEILDERSKRAGRGRASAESSGPEIIKAFMPGKIVQVGVKPGDRVTPGASVLIIEAMKMENEIFCRGAGVVRAVHVKPGQAVENDALLLEIDPEAAL